MGHQMKIYANIIVQDAMPDIARCLDSIASVCDKIYIVDGGSTDGTWEWLESVKEIYNLKLLKHGFRSMLDQRNWLLSKTPTDGWVLAIDQDEALTKPAQMQLRAALELIPQAKLDDCRGKICFTVGLVMYNLINDPYHFAGDMAIPLRSKLFFYEPAVEWVGEYHCSPTVKGSDASINFGIDLTLEYGIKHYAFLNPLRHAKRKLRLEATLKDAGQHEFDQWFTNEHTVEEFPQEW